MGFIANSKLAVRTPVWSPHPIPEIEQVNKPEGRFYRTPDGDFTSVTTFLGETADDSWLDEWRDRVGHEEADAITEEAAEVGNWYHDLNEMWIKNELQPKHVPNDEGRILHVLTRPRLGEYDKFIASEVPLWSKRLGLAGTVDFIAWINGKLVIGDFKNSRNDKAPDMILDYWHQVTIYGIMWWELTGMKPDELHIIMGVRKNLMVHRFTEPFGKRIHEVKERIRKWRKENNRK